METENSFDILYSQIDSVKKELAELLCETPKESQITNSTMQIEQDKRIMEKKALLETLERQLETIEKDFTNAPKSLSKIPQSSLSKIPKPSSINLFPYVSGFN